MLVQCDGMQVIERHGGGSHFVRPDRVYRTGVLTSTMGYDPGADVQSVAASFTQYPMDLALPSGLSGLRGLGMLRGLGARFAAWKARRKAEQSQGVSMGHVGMGHGQGRVYDPRYMPGGNYPQVGVHYSPQEIAKDQMVASLISGGLPRAFARAQVSASLHNWRERWWSGE
jgi:hypothetical protein